MTGDVVDSGAVSQSLRYDPWGTPRSTVPTGYSPFRFQGSWFDDTTSLSWVVTRWYAPSLGRFISEDSLLGEPIEPPSRHLYAYGEGDPIGRWDPDGQDDWWRACSVSSLNCTVGDFDRMSSLDRKGGLAAFQARCAPGWFRGIEGVLLGAYDTVAIRPGRNWFSEVDAYILSSIQDGQRLLSGRGALVPANPGNRIWRDFFSRRLARAGSTELRNLWGRAEQAATDYGVSRSFDRPMTLREWVVKGTTDIWRFSVANGDGITTALDMLGCRAIALCAPIPALYRVARDPLIDPRADAGNVRFMFNVLWRFAGAIICKPVLWPKENRWFNLC